MATGPRVIRRCAAVWIRDSLDRRGGGSQRHRNASPERSPSDFCNPCCLAARHTSRSAGRYCGLAWNTSRSVRPSFLPWDTRDLRTGLPSPCRWSAFSCRRLPPRVLRPGDGPGGHLSLDLSGRAVRRDGSRPPGAGRFVRPRAGRRSRLRQGLAPKWWGSISGASVCVVVGGVLASLAAGMAQESRWRAEQARRDESVARMEADRAAARSAALAEQSAESRHRADDSRKRLDLLADAGRILARRSTTPRRCPRWRA